jgi:4-hydroxybenzoate polyprenyltransferase
MVPLKALVRLTRVWNLLIIGLAQYCTAGLLIHPNTLTDARLFLLTLSTILIAAGGYSINDYYDVKIDLINKPNRVVVGNVLSRRTVLLLHSVLSFTGTALGFLLSWKLGLINLGSGFLLWLYSNALKRLPFVGNLLVAALTGLSVIVVNVLFPPLLANVFAYALFAFFMTLIREILKDMEDLKGDNTFGCRTLPIVWGIRPTKLFIYFLIGVFAAVVVTIHRFITPLPVVFFLGFLVIPMGILVGWLIRADTRRDFHRLSQFTKLIMLAGLFSMAFL